MPVNAETSVNKNDSIYLIADKSAEFPGGIAEMLKYISAKQQLTDNIKATCVYKKTGTVYLKFIVEKDGSITNIVVLLEIVNCKECTEEAISIIKSMPKWYPAIKDKQIVRSYFQVPVKYKP